MFVRVLLSVFLVTVNGEHDPTVIFIMNILIRGYNKSSPGKTRTIRLDSTFSRDQQMGIARNKT